MDIVCENGPRPFSVTAATVKLYRCAVFRPLLTALVVTSSSSTSSVFIGSSRSVICNTYPVISPFWFSSGGGSHCSETTPGATLETVTLIGGALGTAE